MDARLDQCARTLCLSAMNIIGQWSFALRPSVQITRLSFADVPRNFVNAALANGWDM
jgi:ABC-type proline/glycine betaine transport system permease subunit